MKHKNKNHKYPHDHYVYAYALDLGHTYQFKNKVRTLNIDPYKIWVSQITNHVYH